MRVSDSQARETAPEPVVIVDAAGIIRYFTPSFERATGLGPDDVIGRNVRMLASGKREAEIFQAILRVVLRGEALSCTFHSQRKEGIWDEEGLYVMPVFDNDGRPAYYVATLAEEEELRSAAG